MPFSFRLKQRSLALRVKLGVFFFSSSTSGVRVPVKQQKIEVRVYARICGFAYSKKKREENKRGDRRRSRSFVTGLVGPTPGSTRGHRDFTGRILHASRGHRGRHGRPRTSTRAINGATKTDYPTMCNIIRTTTGICPAISGTTPYSLC